MAYSLTYEQNGAGVVVTLTGVATSANIFASSSHIYDPQRLPALRYQIYNLLACSDVEIPADDLQEFAIRDADAHKRNPHFVLAVVIDPKLTPNLQRIYSIYEAAYANNLQVHLFSDVATARTWIESVRLP